MIIQLGINLDLNETRVQATLDFDTGLIGFTEKQDTEIKEYSFIEAPLEFKNALLKKLEEYGETSFLNTKISRKSDLGKMIFMYAENDQKEKD